MGYRDDDGDEPSNSLGHIDLTRDQALRDELSEFTFQDPGDEDWDIDEISEPIAELEGSSTLGPHIDTVYGIDGSRVEVSVGNPILNKRVGFLSIRLVEVNMSVVRKERRQAFLDPQIVENLGEIHSINMVFPSTNTVFGCETTHESWRKMVYKNLRNRSFFGQNLFTTFHELLKRKGRIRNRGQLRLKECPNPNCENSDLFVNSTRPGNCSECRITTYPTDALRTHERVSGSQENIMALNIVMNVIEHLALTNAVKNLKQKGTDALNTTAIVKDGPLAQFDTSAWIHEPILEILSNIQEQHLSNDDGYPFVVTGIHKSGRFAGYADSIRDKFRGPRLLPLPNNHIYEYISPGDRTEPFGYKTYYGKNFVYRSKEESKKGHCIAFTVPRRYEDGFKEGDLVSNLDPYPELPRTATILDELRTIRFEDGLIPLVLAHEQASLPEELSDQILGELTDTLTTYQNL